MTLNDLLADSCQPLPKEAACLSGTEAKDFLALLPDWEMSRDGDSISRDYKFKNYYETLSFLNAAAWIAHQEDHHPNITVTYNHCVIAYSTHSVSGLSRNDFICAAKTDILL